MSTLDLFNRVLSQSLFELGKHIYKFIDFFLSPTFSCYSKDDLKDFLALSFSFDEDRPELNCQLTIIKALKSELIDLNQFFDDCYQVFLEVVKNGVFVGGHFILTFWL